MAAAENRLGSRLRIDQASSSCGSLTSSTRNNIGMLVVPAWQRQQLAVVAVWTRGVSSRCGDLPAGNADATAVADLVAADAIESATFDCFILTQTLQYIFDVEPRWSMCTGACAGRHGPLHGARHQPHPKAQIDREYWRFTPRACRRLFARKFDEGAVDVRGLGNVLACVAFLVGMAAEELSARELQKHDPSVPLLVTVRATKVATERTMAAAGHPS
jgi:hypothetical protein